MRTQVLAQSSFTEAATAWLESRKNHLGPRTIKDYGEMIDTLAEFFSELKLTEIGGDELRAYQKMRMVKAGASRINRECSTIQQMLKRIGRWQEVAPFYQALPMPKESPHRRLTPEEEERLYRVGPRNPKWDVAYCAFCISANTTCGPGELRHIRLMDIDWAENKIYIQPKGAKNNGRIRYIALNAIARKSFEYLFERAKKLGCCQSHHYLLPFRPKKGTYDPERPVLDWRYALREMLVAAEIENLSGYSFRHHCITKLAENPRVSLETLKSIAGWVDPRILKRYSHIHIDAQRTALASLEAIVPKPVQRCGNDTPSRGKTRA